MSPNPDPPTPQTTVIHIRCEDDEATAFMEQRIAEMHAAATKMNAARAKMRRDNVISFAILGALAVILMFEIVFLLFFEGHHQ